MQSISAPPSADPLAERGRWRTKLEAAKELLLRSIASSRAQDVAVFVFAEQTERIFHGARSGFSRAAARIQNLETDGGTNLAGALNAVTEDKDFESYNSITVLILSDGLSNIGDPIQAAGRLIEKYPSGRIDTILIDDTEEGRQVAERVSINGSVRSAFSLPELGEGMDSSRAFSLRQEISGFPTRRLELESELALISNIGSPTLLSVASPVDLTPVALRDDIVPTLEGLESLGRAASDASGLPYLGRISSISQDSPVTISLSGLKDAVELALDWVIPWRRENAKRIAELERRRREAEIEKASIENRQLEVALAASKLELAERMLAHFDPDHTISVRRRQRLLQQLVHGIDAMSKTTLEFKAIGPGPQDETRLTRQ